jgi:DNA-binding MarR family transcriptional regulator
MNVAGKNERCYCIDLRRAAKAVTEYYDRVLLPSDITVNQYAVLVSIADISPCSVSVLAQAVHLERTTLVRTMKPLFLKKLIKDLSEEGERDRQLMVTESGRRCLESARPLWKQAQLKMRQYIGKEKLLDFMEIVSTLDCITKG